MQQNLDFSSLEKYNKKSFSALKTLAVVLIILAVMVLLYGTCILAGLPDDDIAAVFSLIGVSVPVLVIILVVLLITKKSKQHSRVLSAFAARNGFAFQKIGDIPPSTLIDFNGRANNQQWQNVVSGTYKRRHFALGVLNVVLKMPVQRQTLSIYYGLLCVDANTFHNHAVADVLGRAEWNRSNLPGIGSDSSLVQAATLMPADVELNGDKIYFVTKNGLDFSPAGMQKLFQLIDAVNIFDKS